MMIKRSLFPYLVSLSVMIPFAGWVSQGFAQNELPELVLNPRKVKIGGSSHYGSPYYYRIRYGKKRKLIGTVAKDTKGPLNMKILHARESKCMLQFPVTGYLNIQNINQVKCIKKEKKEKREKREKS